MQDRRDNPVSTASQEALDHAERALWRLMTFYGTPLDDIDAAVAADPTWVLPVLMKAGFLMGLSEGGFARDGAAVLASAGPLLDRANARERAHHAALQRLRAGDWDGACASWEALLLQHPRDALALQWAHLHDFYRGDASNLRQRVARVLPEWDETDPLHPHVLAMHAFGLEESNLHAQAEDVGRRALAADPKAPWAVHAVAHVMEMQGRHAEGTEWLHASRSLWSGNGFAVHLAWHQALFALERLDVQAALALHDEHMPAAKTTIALERLDAAALLWRLHLLQADAGPRWQALAAAWDVSPAAAGHYAFNDVHALLSLIGAGELGRADAWLRLSIERAETTNSATHRAMARDVGLPLMHGLLAFAHAQHADAIAHIWPVRARAHRFGGSHAQRDLIDQTLIAAAARGGELRVGRALLNERRLAKPATPLTHHWAQQLGVPMA